MGEYYRDLKIGCCETIKQMREEEIISVKDQVADPKISPFYVMGDYLAEGMWYRFPFPEEDGTDWRVERDWEKHIEIPLPEGFDIYDVEHGTMTFSTASIRGTTGNINIFIPCIQSKEFKESGLKHSQGYSNKCIWIYMKIRRNGILQTVFKCPYCGACFRVDSSDLQKIKDSLYARTDADYYGRGKDYWNKIADRL